ncbi:MAG: HD domain-containing phosphohydrolase [Candidatus Muiribacteriota bacterium]
MKTVSVRKLKPGMILGRPVFDKNKEVLLDAGVKMTDDYIKRLKSRNIRMVSVLEDETDDEEVEVIDDDADADENNEKAELLNEIDSIPGLGYQKAYETLKKCAGYMDDSDVTTRLAQISKNVSNDTIVLKIFELLQAAEKIDKESSFFIDVLSRQTDTNNKKHILKVMQKMTPDENIVAPLFYSLKGADTVLINEIQILLENINKEKIENTGYKILAENDPQLSSKIIMLLKKMGITKEGNKNKTSDFKKVVKKEKIHEVKKAEEDLLSIEVKKPEVDSFNNIDDDFFEKKFKKDQQVDVKFEKIEYGKNDIEVFKKEYEQSITETENIIRSARGNQDIDPDSIIKIATKIVSQVKLAPENAVNLSEFNTLNNYVLSHSINTGYMSALIAMLGGMSEDEMMEVTIGSLMHDIGMVKVRDLIWNKPQKLPFDDLFDIQKHTIYGIDTLTEISRFKGNIAYISYQHHERLDGSGYPKQKHGIQVPQYSRIVGIADVFQAQTSSRVFRGAYDLNTAFKTLLRKEKEKFDQKYVLSLYNFYVEKINPELKELGPDPKKVLIVDDSQEIRIITKKLIENEFGDKTEIVVAENGKQALEMIIDNKIQPDLIILDIMMPVKDGFQVIDELKQKNIKPVIVMLTAKREQSSVMKAISSGMVKDYIVKPFEKNIIMHKIKKYLSI